MFYNGRKTIGVFLNRAELEFQQVLSKSLTKTAKECDYNIVFLTSFGIRETETMYDLYEKNVVDFAPIEAFDAIIVALDTYDTPSFREKLIEGLHSRAHCPVISFREAAEGFYGILSDANSMVEELVCHLAEVNGAKNICFMAGYEGHYDSQVREHYYRIAMEKLGLSVYENSVFYGDMWKGKGEAAYEFFFSDEQHRPDAIVCANDFMARALTSTLQMHGIRVPQDVMVSGVDDSPESRDVLPRLTSIAVDYRAMAQEAIYLARDLIEGRTREYNTYVPARILYRESTRNFAVCEDKERNEIYRKLNEVLEKHSRQSFFSTDMDGCADYEEMKQIACKNLRLLGNCKEFYLGLLGEENGDIRQFQSDITPFAKLGMGVYEGSLLGVPDMEFLQKELLPREVCDDSWKVYYIRILHNREKIFGYTVVQFENPLDGPDEFYHDWNLTLSQTINNLYATRYLLRLNEINQEKSVTDYLTGLCNRRGMEDYIHEKWPCWAQREHYLICGSVDLDGLKYINDTYGHKEGDWAICTVAAAISQAIGENGIAARTGGDEFVIVLTGTDEQKILVIEQKIRESLEEKNRLSGKPYRAECSMGHYMTPISARESFEECMRLSDIEMYKEKKAKKAGR